MLFFAGNCREWHTTYKFCTDVSIDRMELSRSENLRKKPNNLQEKFSKILLVAVGNIPLFKSMQKYLEYAYSIGCTGKYVTVSATDNGAEFVVLGWLIITCDWILLTVYFIVLMSLPDGITGQRA